MVRQAMTAAWIFYRAIRTDRIFDFHTQHEFRVVVHRSSVCVRALYYVASPLALSSARTNIKFLSYSDDVVGKRDERALLEEELPPLSSLQLSLFFFRPSKAPISLSILVCTW